MRGRAEADAVLCEVARRMGTPAYVYFGDVIRERATRLRAAFGGRFSLSYAVKANPNRALLRLLLPELSALDVSSGGELELALEVGARDRVSFSGPAKTRGELERAVDARAGEIILESIDELTLLADVAKDRCVRQNVLLRVNPRTLPRGFGVGMAKLASHFGIDEEALDDAIEALARRPELTFAGFHIYAGTQCLDASAIADAYAAFASIFTAASAKHGVAPKRLVFGSGLGVRYDEGQRELDLDALAARVNPMLDDLRRSPALAKAELVLELGRYLVGPAGYYLTRVIRTKESRGKTFCICDGGLNHHLAATGHFGSVVRRNYPMFKVGEADAPATGTYQLVGPLCTTIDMLGADAKLPTMRPGDVLAIESSGAYGLTASPVYFIRHPKPREVLVTHLEGEVEISDVTSEGTVF